MRTFAAILLFITAAAAQIPDDDPDARSNYFFEQRKFPNAQIPSGARLNALRQIRQTEAAIRSGKLVRGAGAQNAWTLIGPQPILYSGANYITSGRVTAVAIDPRDNNVVYAGGADGGVWKTADGGTTWTPLTGDQPSLSTGAIALDPSNPDTVYVGTGEENFNSDHYSGAGILKSLDGGATWENIHGPFVQQYIGAIAVNPVDGNIVLAASTVGLYRSTDAGNSWIRVMAGVATAVFFDPAQPGVVWSAIGNAFGAPANGVYQSSDNGVTWTLVTGAAPNQVPSGSKAGRIELVNNPSTPNSLYASVGTAISGPGSALDGIYRTVDGGQNWTKLTVPDFCNPQCWYDLVVRPSPTDPNTVFAGGVILTRSLDGGATWRTPASTAAGAPHVDNHALAFTKDGTRLYNGNDGGMWSTDVFTSGTIAWNDLNATLALTQYYPGQAIHPTNPNIGLAGAQDNGSHLYGGRLSWTRIIGGDGGWAAIDPSTPTTAYGTSQYINLYRTQHLNNPNDFISVVQGINQNDRQRFIGSFVLDPANPQRMYYGTSLLYKSIDGAGLWLPASPDLTNAPKGTAASNRTFTISTIAVSPADPNVIYTGAVSAAVFQTTDGGATWNDRSAGLPTRSVTRVVADPFDASAVCVTYSGYAAAGEAHPGHIFKSSDGGITWTDISGNLPNLPVDDLVIDPDLANTFYVGTDLGVMVSTDGGGSWATLGTGLPNVAVPTLALHRPTRILRAGTHGRSMWDYALPTATSAQPVITSLSPASANAGSGAFTLTVAGSNLGPGMHVWWNGQDRTVATATATTMTVQILDSDVQSVGRAAVTVFNPSFGAGASIPANFVIGPAPGINSGGLVSAANPLGGSTASPGAIMSLFGPNLTGLAESAVDFPLPQTLGGVTLTIGGFTAPLYFVSATQANFVVPYGVSTRSALTVIVSQGTLASQAASLAMAQVTPSLFSSNQQGSGQGSIRIANSATIAAPTGDFADSRPAQAGEYIEIYCTGLGIVFPSVFDGAAASSSPLSRTVIQPTVTIGGVPAIVAFSGLAPGSAGLYQVDAQVPAGVTPGSAVPVVLTSGGVTSNTVTVAIQ